MHFSISVLVSTLSSMLIYGLVCSYSHVFEKDNYNNVITILIYLQGDFQMISANNVTYRVGKKALFEDVNIKFTEGTAMV